MLKNKKISRYFKLTLTTLLLTVVCSVNLLVGVGLAGTENEVRKLKNEKKVFVLADKISIDIVPAALASGPGSDTSSEDSDDIQGIAKIVQYLVMISWPALVIIGDLLDNSILFEGVCAENQFDKTTGECASDNNAIEVRLRSIWVQIRNLVNIAFVLILLFIAAANVMDLGGGEGGNFAIKTILPKFVIALILVNFSFLFCKVILDASSVLTAAILYALMVEYKQWD